MPQLTDYRGKGAVVTGASSGIGRLIALKMARKGARVALVARRTAELEKVADEARGFGQEPLVLACDVGDRAAVESAAQRALAVLGGIDILVNNAGYGGHRRFADWPVEDIERMMRVNFLGSVYWTKALLPYMFERRSGWIVFMASVAGKIGVPDESAYAASKFAMVGLGEAIASELEDFGIHVLTVCPGAVNTDFFDEEARARMPEVAKKSMIAPERVVDATLAALARGKHDVTVPASIRAGYVVRALAPELMRRQVKRTTIG